MLYTLLLALLVFHVVLAPGVSLAQASAWGPRVILVRITGTIDNSVAGYIREALDYARSMRYPLLIYLDTPGGYLDASLRIVRYIDESGVPVIAYAGGQWAVSAGTLILLSSPVAYAAPYTVIGSMQPVMITPEGVKPVNYSKIINTLVKIVEVHCKAFGRNATAAKLFVIKNLNLDGEEAARYHVIDGVARSIEDLLNKVNGKRVKLFNGEYVVLRLNGEVIEYKMPLRYRIVRVLSDPTIAGILFSLGSLIILFSLISGHWHSLPIGLLLLLLALAGLGYNVNAIAVVLIAIGAVLLALELTVIPGFGIVGITGVAMLILGAALLPFSSNLLVSREYVKTLIYTVMGVGFVFAALVIIVAYKVVGAIRKPVATTPVPIGKIGYAVDEITPDKIGFVKIEGEYWEARSVHSVIKPGQRVRVVKKEGPVLIVEPIAEEGSDG